MSLALFFHIFLVVVPTIYRISVKKRPERPRKTGRTSPKNGRNVRENRAERPRRTCKRTHRPYTVWQRRTNVSEQWPGQRQSESLFTWRNRTVQAGIVFLMTHCLHVQCQWMSLSACQENESGCLLVDRFPGPTRLVLTCAFSPFIAHYRTCVTKMTWRTFYNSFDTEIETVKQYKPSDELVKSN